MTAIAQFVGGIVLGIATAAMAGCVATACWMIWQNAKKDNDDHG